MPRISVHVERDHGTEAFIERLHARVEEGMAMWGMLAADLARTVAPEKSGTMARSVTVSQPTRTAVGWIIYVGPGLEAPYAPYTELARYLITAAGKQKHLGQVSVMKGAKMPWLVPSVDDQKVTEAGKGMLATAIRSATGG